MSGMPRDPFEDALSGLKKYLVDMDGDGRPDAVTTADLNRAIPRMMPERDMRRLTNQRRAGVELGSDQSRAAAGHDIRQREVSDNAAGAGMNALAAGGVGLATGAAIGALPLVPPALLAAGVLSYGLTTASKSANGGPNDSDMREIVRSLEGQGSPELSSAKEALARAEADVARTRDEQSSLTQGYTSPAQGSRRPSQQMLDASRTSATSAVAARDSAKGTYDAELQRVRETAAQRGESVISARSNAATERDRIRADAPQPFHKKYDSWREELPFLPDAALAPYVAGAGAVAVKNALPVASSWMARGQASKLLRAGEPTAETAARVTDIAAKNAGRPSILSAEDFATGAVGGASFGTLPLAYNALNQQAVNPERTANDAYAAGLLDIDPQRGRAQALAEATPHDNPYYRPIMNNPIDWASGLATGAFEGAAGGKVAGLVMESLKPRFKNALAAVNGFDDTVAANAIRSRQAQAYGAQPIEGTLPKPPSYNPVLPPPPRPLPSEPVPPPPGGQTLPPGPTTSGGTGPGHGAGPPPVIPTEAGPIRPPGSTQSGNQGGSSGASYGTAHKNMLRPEILNRLAGGGNVPTAAEAEALFAGGKRALPMPMEALSPKLAEAQAVVNELRGAGAPPEMIAAVLRRLMSARGQTTYPAIGAAAGLGGARNILADDSQ